MEWGVLLSTARREPRTTGDVLESSVRHAVTAERVGFGSAWVLEHHFTDYAINPDTMAFAGYLLGATSRLEVGTAVTIAPFLHPVRIAESTALLDHLSGGRFRLGLGRGVCPEDFVIFGQDPSLSHEMLRESVDIMLQAWSGNPVEGVGPHYKFPPVSVLPEPLTRPRPPVYVAAESPSSVEWAAAHGFPLLLQLGTENEELRARLELYGDLAEAVGRDPAGVDHTVLCIGHVADSAEAARAAVVGNLEWWGERSSDIGFEVEELKRLPNYRYHLNRVEQWVLKGKDTSSWVQEWLDNSPIGTLEQCIERLERLICETGVSRVVLGLEGSGDPQTIEENIERFAGEIIPQVSGDHARPVALTAQGAR